MTDDAALSGDSAVILDLCVKLAKAEAERDAAVIMLRVLGEETVLAGYPGGDRNQTLANVRALRAERDALVKALTYARKCLAVAYNQHGVKMTEIFDGDWLTSIDAAIARDEP